MLFVKYLLFELAYFLGLALISGSGVGGSGVPFCSLLSLAAATSNGSRVVIASDLVGRCFFFGPLTRDFVMEVKAAVSSITLKSMEEVVTPLVRLSSDSGSCGIDLLNFELLVL